ncbi:hypothetical protein LCGC14_1440310 [marine sediment metagenome]|uniref:Uncharacterized protein n=1 Tax=marine sediment metagenome TaxID=412755 RepID=A0A0F9K730_9ZZZZ
MNVSTQVAELLDVLAARFGTTAEYLWATMVRHHVIEGWLQVAAGGGLILGGLVAGGFAYRAHQAVRRLIDLGRGTGETGYSWDARLRDTKGCRTFLLCVFGGLVLIGSGIALTAGLQQILIPEYYALQEILRVLQ